MIDKSCGLYITGVVLVMWTDMPWEGVGGGWEVSRGEVCTGGEWVSSRVIRHERGMGGQQGGGMP